MLLFEWGPFCGKSLSNIAKTQHFLLPGFCTWVDVYSANWGRPTAGSTTANCPSGFATDWGSSTTWSFLLEWETLVLDTGDSWATFSSSLVVAFSTFFATGFDARVAPDCATVSSPACSPSPVTSLAGCLRNVLIWVTSYDELDDDRVWLPFKARFFPLWSRVPN